MCRIYYNTRKRSRDTDTDTEAANEANKIIRTVESDQAVLPLPPIGRPIPTSEGGSPYHVVASQLPDTEFIPCQIRMPSVSPPTEINNAHAAVAGIHNGTFRAVESYQAVRPWPSIRYNPNSAGEGCSSSDELAAALPQYPVGLFNHSQTSAGPTAVDRFPDENIETVPWEMHYRAPEQDTVLNSDERIDQFMSEWNNDWTSNLDPVLNNNSTGGVDEIDNMSSRVLGNNNNSISSRNPPPPPD